MDAPSGLAMRRRTLLQAAALCAFAPRQAAASDTVLTLASFPGYHVPATLTAFTERTGIAVTVQVFDSNEDLLAACLRGEHYDLLTISHYMVPHFAALGLLRPVTSSTLQLLGPMHWLRKYAHFGQLDQQWFAVPKNYGTTGYLYRRSKLPVLQNWHDFWDAVTTHAKRRCSVIEDVQTLIGAALCYHGHSINSTDPAQLLQAEQLLQSCRPYLRAMVADVDAAAAAGDWLLMSWSDSGYALTQADPDWQFVQPRSSEAWCDFYGVGRESSQPDRAEALLQWLLQPEQVAQEVIELGVSPVDERVLALLPETVRNNAIIFPPRAVLANLEMSSQEALREPLRGEIFARFAASF